MDRDELLSQHLSDISDSLSCPEPPADVEDALRITLNYTPRGNNDQTKEVLQSFIENLPPEGSQVACRYILQHNDQDSLQGLADHLLKAILAPSWLPLPDPWRILTNILNLTVRACGGQTLVTSNSPSGNADDIASEMVEASTRASLRLIKLLCLRRDNYRCVLSGRFAKEALGQYTEIPDSEIRKHMLTAHISHIIPFALDPWSNDTEVSAYNMGLSGFLIKRFRRRKKSNTWTTMFSLFPGLDSVIKPEHINAGQNLMILSYSLNHEFGSLDGY